MSRNNIIDFPVQATDNVERRHSLAGIQAQRLRKLFIAGEKGQVPVFERLSCRIELLTRDLKVRYGDRSGKMTNIFGQEYVRVAGRFTANGGKPPKQLYRTPKTWLRIIDGFAAEQSGSRDAFVADVLENALYGTHEAGRTSDLVWRNELQALIDAMTDRLSREVDLRSIEDYVSGSGLYLENSSISVSEWPSDLIGQTENEAFRAYVLGLVPHVLGLNYVPVVDVHMPMSEETKALVFTSSDILPDAVNHAAGIGVKAGTRIGAAITVHAETKQPTFALIECQVAHLCLKDNAGCILAVHETSVDLKPFLTAKHKKALGTPGSSGVGTLPENWLPNSVRFQFPGSAGFERLARSLIVKPWIWTDLEENDFWRGDAEEADDYPVSSPIHTVAAAIESNLLYAENADRGGGKEARLDVRLLTEMRRVEALVTRFRLSHDARRRAHRDALMTEWRDGGDSDKPDTPHIVVSLTRDQEIEG